MDVEGFLILYREVREVCSAWATGQGYNRIQYGEPFNIVVENKIVRFLITPNTSGMHTSLEFNIKYLREPSLKIVTDASLREKKEKEKEKEKTERAREELVEVIKKLQEEYRLLVGETHHQEMLAGYSDFRYPHTY
jgi:hypothetical protein